MAEDGLSITSNSSSEMLCRALLDAAEEHGVATEGWEMAWGDVEQLFRAAFVLLTPGQQSRFWGDERVMDVVQDCPEYEAIAAVIYGSRQGRSEPDTEDALG